MGPKIGIIGAGSAVFSLNLIRDFCLTPNLNGATIALMDVDQARLDAIHALIGRYAAEVGAEIEATKTTDRREALDGADFVINTALVTGYGPARDGWAIAQRLGYRFGGSLHVMHDEPFWVNAYQMRFFEDVVEEVLEICPDAWYLQVANPVLAGITDLGRKYPEAKIVGLCHGFAGVYRLADVLGLDRERLTFEIPGVNHSVFLTHAYHDGEDVFPLLDRWIETDAAAYWETCPPSDFMGPVPVDVYRRFGVFPIGDTCNPGGGSWPWPYHVDAATERRWHENPAGWWDRYFQHGQEEVTAIERITRDPATRVTDAFPPKMSGEVMAPLIESIHCDIPRVLTVNILNRGDFVPGIPRDFAVEIPALVSKRGIEGIQTRPLPPAILAQIWRDRIATVTTELAAFDEGSRERLLELILMDPWTRSLDQARQLLDDILAMPANAALRARYQ
jgi:alpha-galactosidase/6-phospho-beta-glucosidase family protein